MSSEATAASTTAAPPKISAQNVWKTFGEDGDPRQVVALKGLSLDIPQNQFICLLGPSGCGKSTLLNITGGLMKASSGQVTVNGIKVEKPMPKDVAFVFQENTLFPWSTIIDNIRVGLEFQGVPKRDWDERAFPALESVGMADFAHHYPDQLSVGMKQRIALARGLSLQTDVLLMDEPFAALDEQTRMVLGEDLSVLLTKTTKTIVFVTHSLAEAVFLSDRIYVFTARPGRIKEIVDVEEAHPRHPEFMTSDKFNNLRNRLYELLRDEIRQTVQQSAASAGG